MLQISADLLAMSSDAAVLIKNGKVAFANSGAHGLLGHDCAGKRVKELFGSDIAEVQASSFIGEFPIDDKRYIVRVRSADGIKAMFLTSLEEQESLINDAFIFSLRNCLMSINLTLSLINDRAESQPELRDSLSVISHECFRINRILSNISVIRSIREKNLVFAPVFMDISAFMEELTDSVRLITSGPEIRFSSPGEINIYADPSLIECLFLNLISNCLMHARDCSRISITLTQGRERVFLSVDDDGCGIPPESLHSVFDRYRHSFDLSDMSRGAGLGLTASRAIAGVHGGTLLLESRPDIGTAVRVSLSHNPYSEKYLKHPNQIYEREMRNMLTGLADCLPSEFFSDKYID